MRPLTAGKRHQDASAAATRTEPMHLPADGGADTRRAMAQCAVRAFGLLDVHKPERNAVAAPKPSQQTEAHLQGARGQKPPQQTEAQIQGARWRSVLDVHKPERNAVAAPPRSDAACLIKSHKQSEARWGTGPQGGMRRYLFELWRVLTGKGSPSCVLEVRGASSA